MKSTLLRPKNLCVLLILLVVATLILCFQYQNTSLRDWYASPRLEEPKKSESDGYRQPPESIVDPNSLDQPVEKVPVSFTAIRVDDPPSKESSTKALPPIIDFESPKRKSDFCSAKLSKSKVDIDTVESYKTLEFSKYDMNFWNSQWEERYLKIKSDPQKPPLKVIVVPHSHNDPGWLRTFDDYFQRQTAPILDNMLAFLSSHQDFKFVWSEMSLFARWWQRLQNRPNAKPQVVDLIERGQLELLTGGWVMTDEAGVNLYAMLDQLIEGHQWIRFHLGEKALPKNGWSIDPFGHGNAVPYLLRRSGIHNTFIQRTHYAWKSLLTDRRQLEFLWETIFKRKTASPEAIMCHMAPFDLYSIKHACGPDKQTCLRFDYRRLSGEYSESRSEPVSDKNIHSQATAMLGQYGRLASFFEHNIALVLLGDDFRFDHSLEWEQQYDNYNKIINYVNDHSAVFGDAHMSFGTLADYWNEVYKRQKEFPKLSGDFMPYSDVYSEGLPNYWTGYYTTRPFLKQLSREVQHYLRAAEILFTLGRRSLLSGGNEQLRSRLDADYRALTTARNQLGIFQHHDAVTGTSKDFVMKDYGARLFVALTNVQSIIAHLVQYLQVKNKPRYQPLGANNSSQQPFSTYLQFSEKKQSYETLPVRMPLRISPRQPNVLVVYNSHGHVVQDVIRCVVTQPVQKVVGPGNKEFVFQLNPIWEYSAEINADMYELVFIGDLAPLSTTTFEIHGLAAGETSKIPAVSVKLFLSDTWGDAATSTLSNGHLFNFENSGHGDVSLTNDNLHAVFSSHTGLLSHLNGRPVGLSFGAYRSVDFHSGAYLFRPETGSPPFNVTGRFPMTRLVRGPVMSEMIVVYPNTVMQRARVYHTTGPLSLGVELETSFDLSIRREYFEFFMTIKSDVSSGQEFFTDSGGFEIVRRVRNDLLPIEANYYPMTEALFIEDDTRRLTLLANHPHGVTSSSPGHLEVMLERKLRHDDARGLGEGVVDNLHTKAKFWLLAESLQGKTEVPLLSRNSHILSTMLNYPPIVLQSTPQADQRELIEQVSFLRQPTACDLHLLAIRTMPSDKYHKPSDKALMVLHHRAPDCRFSSATGCSDNSRGVDFEDGLVALITETSLTGTTNGKTVPGKRIQVAPHELASFVLLMKEGDGEVLKAVPHEVDGIERPPST
ncbi:alpha-mannosidase 2 [Galendromus occidentalis]|uniref:Alpha-mannosidase n=1 Tax=Galendromus occidentalis TaxID=34638 RepID=A0AAJ6VVC6_9ACAR|nr:alpha-mannosidase 2 [Galendromus occidentalis]